MKIKVKLNEQPIENNLQKINSMLLCGMITLADICYSQRISHKSFYIMAFRISRNKYNCDEYINALKTLESDIYSCKNKDKRIALSKLLAGYVKFSPFNGDEKFEYYKKYIYKKIL